MPAENTPLESPPASAADREIVSRRVFQASRERLWAVFADPARLAHWWGPNGFTNTIHEFDLRPGGKWRLTMHAPNGANFDNDKTFLEVIPGEKVAFRHHGPMHAFTMTITYAPAGRDTEVTWRMIFDSAAECAKVKGFILPANEQNFDRLAAELALASPATPPPATAEPRQPFTLVREFDAPRDVVWKAWTDVTELKRWFSPQGFTLPTANLDLRPGGIFHYGLRSPDGHEMWGKWTFREIVPPEKLVVVVSFSDAQQGVTRHPMSATWPLETLSATTFTQRDGKTTLRLEWSPLNATEAERKTFDNSHDGMKIGWGGTMDQLAAYLAQR